ncbi:MAG TPA: hypothetical protein VD833_24980 [Vicinamibacterales bacterium]|nr:hypothetical protein [Vicinamibacterales bacterium]
MTLTRRILAEKRRYIYPIVAAIVVNAALFLAVVVPLSRRVAGGEMEAQAAAAALARARRDHAAARSTVSGKASADEELKKFYSAVLPSTQRDARSITFFRLNELAEEADLQRERSTIDTDQERGSELGKLTATYVLSGPYRNIRRFVHSLETAEEFLILENVALTQSTEGEGDLIVNVQVSTYYRVGAHGG